MVTWFARRPVRDLRPGDHAWLAYGSRQEQEHVIGAFIRDGLTGTDRVVYITGASPRELPGMTRYRTDPAPYAETGQLTAVIERLLAPYAQPPAQAESMPGWGRRAAQDAVAETGVDMTRFPTGAHLSSWAGRTPLDNQSGKRTGRSKSKKGNRYLAGLLGETAVAAGRTQTREGARYRRIARRRGKLKAQVALGNTQLKVYHALLSSPGTRYQDLGPGYYERRTDIRRQIAHHVGKLAALGFEATLARLPSPDPDGTSNQAA